MDIVIKVPDKKAPGFIKRQIATLDYAAAWRAAQDEDDGSVESLMRIKKAWEQTIEHLLGFVEAPSDRSEARNALLEASEETIQGIIDLVRGKNADVPLVSTPS